MSKSNMLLGLARGKVGDLVFYRDGGEQRTRTRVIPKNPRTPAQMEQRSKIANVSALYRVLAPIVADSFTNRPSNQSGYNAFASVAISLAPYMTKELAATDAVFPQDCQLSKGILQSLGARVAEVDGEQAFSIALNGGLTTDSTIGAVSTALLAQYPTLQAGDKIVAVQVKFKQSAESLGSDSLYTAALSTSSFVVDPNSTEVLGDTDFTIVDNEFSYLRLSDSFEAETQLAAYIVCRKDEGGALQCSSEWATLSELARTMYANKISDAAKAAAIESYMAGTESILR